PNPGDLIVALGGRTGRDGIHGATFSSAELTDTHADEFSHAVQIGNAIEEKRVLDAILRARDTDNGPLFTSITDCGAGGFSSAVGEMGEKLGADVHLDKAPLKYDGLSYTEIWISEAQERMVLAVPPSNLDALQQICDEEHVELAVLGTFGTDNKDLVLNYHGTEVGRLPMAFLHDGIPTPTRTASWSRSAAPQPTTDAPPSISEALLKLLAHPNIASKHAIIRQYDHEVQGNTIIKPLLGPRSVGPSDAAVIEPVAGTGKGLAIACGLATLIGDTQRGGDPYLMALAAIDEAVRNLVATGADPDRIAILDNFCWPSCGKPENLASLVRAAEGCYDAAKAYRTPFVSGKDSLNNQFTTESGRTIEIPPTLLITGIAPIHDLGKVMTSDPKSPGYFVLLLVGETQGTLLASHYEHVAGPQKGDLPRVDLEKGPDTARKIHTLIQQGLVHAVHDVSDGGALTAVAEMLIAAHSPDAPIGAEVTITDPVECFDESPSRYIIEAAPHDVARIRELLGDTPCTGIANLNDSGAMSIAGERLSIEELTHAWRSPLDW
ncbi:MAG: AIR synthase-related protein, partial [Planctomycetota bacterium]